ncbi:Metallo-dependent phosphatase-like protein [Sphaerosporella brunnea]|uniref:Metallo-dependent phosphatase-like protein n=1 Tax=Sphaerosporella brunnea TaxID=1250544 RepID=A0A5J5EC49_9PEZI|nr:Metallo-dependent phosphatase-like protein [Sphaerosporella brunnea]
MRPFEVALVAASLRLSHAIQPQAKNPVDGQEFRDLEWGQLNFLHTTDNHGWHGGHLQEPQYSADLGDYISFVSHMRRRAHEKDVDFLVVDTGDRSEGNGLWDASDPKGMYTRRILQQLDVDILTTGNHELYNGTTALNEHLEMVPFFGDRYLSSNIDINWRGEWEPFANRSLKFVTPKMGFNVTAFGFLFNFTGNHPITRVKPVATVLEEQWFKDAIADKEVDLFLVAAHIDVHTLELQQIHDAIRAANPETPIQIFGGHSHIRDFKVFDEKSTALESGRYCETVGFLSLDGLAPEHGPKPKDGGAITTFRRYIDFNRPGFQHHSGTGGANFDTPEGLSMSKEITSYRQLLDLNRLIGCAPQDFSLMKDPFPGPHNWYSYLAETILPEMVRNPMRDSHPRMIFINGGSQRFDVFKGPFTYDTSFLVSPFTSRFMYAKDVEWNVATQLLDYFNNDASPYSASARAKGDLPPLDKHADYDDAKQPRNVMPGAQIPLGRRKKQKQKKRTLVKGYTTNDDFGHDGDDTVHEYFEKYPTPKVLQSNASFPADYATNPPPVVDVVFFDFIAENVADGLNAIVSRPDAWSRDMFEMYMGREDTLTKLILEFAAKEWGRDCV